ncbi:MAG: hypothetical protein C1943_14850 [Halochromatium sp.]|nr:hypothetical protein [Halochromatium sp.]
MFNTPAQSYQMALMLVLGMIASQAYASPPSSDRADGIRVEHLSSSRYDVSRVRVKHDLESIRVSGEVARVIPQRGMIPGKVRISLIDADGQLLEQAMVKPMRRNRQDQSAHFYARLATPTVVEGSHVSLPISLLIEHSGR